MSIKKKQGNTLSDESLVEINVRISRVVDRGIERLAYERDQAKVYIIETALRRYLKLPSIAPRRPGARVKSPTVPDTSKISEAIQGGL